MNTIQTYLASLAIGSTLLFGGFAQNQARAMENLTNRPTAVESTRQNSLDDIISQYAIPNFKVLERHSDGFKLEEDLKLSKHELQDIAGYVLEGLMPEYTLFHDADLTFRSTIEAKGNSIKVNYKVIDHNRDDNQIVLCKSFLGRMQDEQGNPRVDFYNTWNYETNNPFSRKDDENQIVSMMSKTREDVEGVIGFISQNKQHFLCQTSDPAPQSFQKVYAGKSYATHRDAYSLDLWEKESQSRSIEDIFKRHNEMQQDLYVPPKRWELD